MTQALIDALRRIRDEDANGYYAKIANDAIAAALASTQAEPVAQAETTKQKFDRLWEFEPGYDPVEALRFFCSLAMSGRDWLDVEPLFDALTAALQPEPSQQQTAVRVTCSFKTESGNFGDEIARCQVCGAHQGSPSAQNCVNRAALPRSTPANSPLGRDADWALARAKALGTDSGYSIPIVPSVEAFRELFAAVRSTPEAPEPDENRSSVQHSGQWSGEQDAKDAARYRWLRDHRNRPEVDSSVQPYLIVGYAEHEDVLWFDELDAAIDAAMADAAIRTQGTEG